jgi:hypothetical protein
MKFRRGNGSLGKNIVRVGCPGGRFKLREKDGAFLLTDYLETSILWSGKGREGKIQFNEG